jgi:hypothetical protein
MKVHQIISESQVDEAPGGGFNIWNKIKSKVGTAGSKASGQGKLDVNARAKALWKSYSQFASQTGIQEPSTPTKAEVADFMATQKMPTGQLNKHKDGPLPKGAIDTILQGAAQDSFKGQAGQAAVGQEEPEPEEPKTLGQQYGTTPDANAPAPAKKEVPPVNPNAPEVKPVAPVEPEVKPVDPPVEFKKGDAITYTSTRGKKGAGTVVGPAKVPGQTIIQNKSSPNGVAVKTASMELSAQTDPALQTSIDGLKKQGYEISKDGKPV